MVTTLRYELEMARLFGNWSIDIVISQNKKKQAESDVAGPFLEFFLLS